MAGNILYFDRGPQAEIIEGKVFTPITFDQIDFSDNSPNLSVNNDPTENAPHFFSQAMPESNKNETS